MALPIGDSMLIRRLIGLARIVVTMRNVISRPAFSEYTTTELFMATASSEALSSNTRAVKIMRSR